MASHGAMKEVAAEAPRTAKKPAKELMHGELKEAENGGVTMEHHFTSYEHKPELHVFGSDEGHKLAAHIEEHFGIKMPGRAEGTVAKPSGGEEGKED